MTRAKYTTKEICITALFAALICVIAPISVDIGISPVPITLSVMITFFTGCVAGVKKGVIAVSVYVLLGAFGVPVFSRFQGGFQVLTGPTGGFIIGYIPCVLIISLMLKITRKPYMYPVAMSVALLTLYLFGAIWFTATTKSPITKAIKLCVAPFAIVDAVKIICVSVISVSVYPLIEKYVSATFL